MSNLVVGKWCGYCGQHVNSSILILTNEDLFLIHLNNCEKELALKEKQKRLEFYKKSMETLDPIKNKSLWAAAKDGYDRILNEGKEKNKNVS